MNAPKTTLTATVLAAAFGLVLGLSAVPSDSYACHKTQPHGKETGCADAGGFTAELTGAFVFGPDRSVTVTPNSKESALSSNTDLDMVRAAGGGDANIWNEVFNDCSALLAPGSILNFRAGDDNWRINWDPVSAKVGVVFIDIQLPDGAPTAEVTAQLIGATEGQPLLPGDGEPVTFTLDRFRIWGSTLRGTRPRRSCDASGISPLTNGSISLTITRQ